MDEVMQKTETAFVRPEQNENRLASGFCDDVGAKTRVGRRYRFARGRRGARIGLSLSGVEAD